MTNVSETCGHVIGHFLSKLHTCCISSVIHSEAGMDDKIGSPDLPHFMCPLKFLRLHEQSREIANNWEVKQKSLSNQLNVLYLGLPRSSVFLGITG